MIKIIYTLIFTHFFLFITLYGCKENDKKKKEISFLSLVEQTGVFSAKFFPINPEVSKYLNGSLTLFIEDRKLHATIRFSQGPINSIHEQSLFFGERCPNQSDDLNGDGLIDSEEFSFLFRNNLIPLDDDLSSQRMGSGIYPKSNEFGSYLWSRNTNLDSLLDDLKEEDINPKDHLVKLQKNQSLNIEDLIVVIKGIPDDSLLPDSILNKGLKDSFSSFPVACGKLKKILKAPGVIDRDRAITEDEEDFPQEDGIDFPENSSENPTNYGDGFAHNDESLLHQ